MLGFIKNWFKKEEPKLEQREQEIKKESHFKPQKVVDAYFRYLKFYNTTFDVDYFCKECRASEEEINEVHKLIKEKLIKIKMERLNGDFE